MDSFRLCLALGPLAIYLLLLGAINLSRRPFLVTGARDLAALGVAVAGLVVVGPIELLLPEDANARLFREAIENLDAESIAVPDFDLQHLLRGHAVHFRCTREDVAGLRIDSHVDATWSQGLQ